MKKREWLYLALIVIFLSIGFRFILWPFIQTLANKGLAEAYTAFGTLLLAIVTFLLACAAFGTIWQNHLLQKREHRERLLNEIIEWATDILECVPEIIIPPTGAKSKDTMLGLTMFNLVSKYTSVDARTEYVKGIASTFGKSLESAVEIVSQQLTEVIKFVLSHPPDERSYDMVGGYTKPLSASTVALIKTATKIKTRDIGKKEENMSKEGEAKGSKEPTLKSIEDHLKHQDRQMARGSYVSGAAVGAAIVLVAVSLWVGRTVLPTDAFYWTYIFLLACGFGFMFWCQYKQSKVK